MMCGTRSHQRVAHQVIRVALLACAIAFAGCASLPTPVMPADENDPETFAAPEPTPMIESPPIEAIEYKGYRIRPAPYRNNNVYQNAGTIEKDTPEGVKEHRFVRADTYHNRDDAIAFTISKAKQIIDQQGDRIFT